MYDGLNLEGKRVFLDKFWADRDPAPATPENEFRMEHLKRFTFVNVNFTTTVQKNGWKCDMGRVYIQYGPPDEIERHPADAENNAWEMWIYEALRGQGNIVFIFGDLEGFGRYTLLHSNLQYEKFDENWEKWINRYSGRY
jgi:GWxTD domain-containing protein